VIGTVTAALADFGLLRPGSKPRCHIGLTKGDTLWMDAFIDLRNYFHVKCSEVISLREEARIYAEAAAHYADFVPRTLGYCVRDGWEIFVTEGVAHRQFFPDDLRNPRHARNWIPILCRFLEQSWLNRRTVGQSDTVALLGMLETRFKDSSFAPLLIPWCSGTGQRELEALGSIRQHCDFVPNNLGVTASGLVIFDWEDYGKICLPGLDLCTLVLTCFDVDVDALSLDGGLVVTERCAGFVIPACAALRMDVSLFWRLVPLYMLVFLYLKSTYASDVRNRIDALLRRVASGSH
jgi:hypothetical protein